MPELSRQFHGARREIADTHVRPPSVTGVRAASSIGFSSGSNRPAHTDIAFATPSENVAWSYARAVPQHNDHPVNNDPDPKHRSRVYEVGHAPDEYRDHPSSQEIESEKGFPIQKAHHSEIGATSTFHEVNWNAYKAKGKHSPFVPNSSDANHSYMATDPDVKPFVPKPHQEAGSNKGREEDQRHPDQLNLFTGHTVAEHNTYNNTPGMMVHLNPSQFPHAESMHKDPTTSVIRASKGYASADKTLGTTR